jgi:hypothetical protein
LREHRSRRDRGIGRDGARAKLTARTVRAGEEELFKARERGPCV